MGHLEELFLAFTLLARAPQTFVRTSVLFSSPSCLGVNSIRLLSPNIWCKPCSKAKNDPDNATQKNKQRLSQPGDEVLPQTSAQNHPPIQNLTSIVEGLEHATFDGI
jgi:hypothetical protein